MNAARREEFRHLLLEERERLLGQRDRVADRQEETASESISELSLYDNHPADVGTQTWRRGQEVGLRMRAEDRLALVDAALGRLDDGSYGYCVRCGQPVEAARLRAVPETPYCRSCRAEVDAGPELAGADAASLEPAGRSPGAAAAVARPTPGEPRTAMVGAETAGPESRRPVEEEVLAPPYGRTFLDETGNVGFDGEDAWQAVARYGSSDTPSDVPEAHRYPHIVIDPHESRGAVQEVEREPDRG